MTDPAVPHANGRAWINFDLPSSGRYCQLTDGVQPTERPAAIGQKPPFDRAWIDISSVPDSATRAAIPAEQAGENYLRV